MKIVRASLTIGDEAVRHVVHNNMSSYEGTKVSGCITAENFLQLSGADMMDCE